MSCPTDPPQPVELFPQLSALRPRIFSYFRDFVLRYCDSKVDRFGRPDHSGSSNLTELHAVLSATVMIRRRKETVLTQLPPKQRQKVTVDISEKSKKVIAKVRKELNTIKNAFVEVEGATAEQLNDGRFQHGRLINELFRDTGRAKLPSVLSFLGENFLDLDEVPKFVVFAIQLDVLDGIEHELNSRRIKHIRISGETDPNQRKALVDHFQNDPV